ncbi:MAG: hypothetical protein HY565_02065 [Candidatus Kerfeldbacteria bacterium]|nr:hypothetical protein [Candidatus Kerfeldbacteria bacterium]
MIKQIQYVVGLGVSLALPLSGWAFTAELQSISPEPTLDISDQVTGAPDNVVIAGWVGIEEDTEYTAVFTADESPAGVITPGGDISLDTPWEYDATAGTVTVTFTGSGLKSVNDMPSNVGMVALVGVVAEGEDGPPEAMTGFWLSTDMQDWALIPPSPEQDTPAFGFSLTGPAGETGFIHMFMPTGIKDLLSQYTGQELTWDDLAVFSGDSQSSLSLTEVDGGAYIDINVVFSDTTTSISVASSSVTKELTVQKQLPISLAASKTEVKKNKEFDLYGWLKSGKKGKTVTVWRKLSGEKTFTKVDTLTTVKAGYFSETYTTTKTAKYKVKYGTGSSAKVSSVTTVTVNK